MTGDEIQAGLILLTVSIVLIFVALCARIHDEWKDK